jgi:transposase
MKMPKTYIITAENSKELREAMKAKGNARYYRKLQTVALRGEGKDNDEISAITGYHTVYISRLVGIYSNEGIEGLCKDGRKGGNNRNLSKEEELIFLSKFEEKAKSGQIITVGEIADAYDKETGKEHVSKSTAYYLLKKHGWRQITPQTIHPDKANEAEIEASKKLTLSLRK